MSMQLLPIKNQMVEVGRGWSAQALDLFFMPLLFRFREEVCSTSPPTNFHHIVKNTPPPQKKKRKEKRKQTNRQTKTTTIIKRKRKERKNYKNYKWNKSKPWSPLVN